MFSSLANKMRGLMAKWAGRSALTQSNITEAVEEVRTALLEADVHFGVVKTLLERIQIKALGLEVTATVTPGQQFIKVVHDELVQLMGGQEATLSLGHAPTVIMLCGLQGSGKTTASVKLAHYLTKKQQVKKPLIAACDLQRPAAVEQLQLLGQKAQVAVYGKPGEKNPLVVAQEALAHAKTSGHDLLILDTAGRLHLDEPLMAELVQLKAQLLPQEVLFVANGALGQDAVATAAAFHQKVGMTGSIITMLDGDARAGAVLSIYEITKQPLKFEGVGEAIEDLRPFHPASMADRILGMGDTVNLVRKAEEHLDKQEVERLGKKLEKATFTYEDYLQQMQMMKKMGPLHQLMGMLPGMSALPAGLGESGEKEMKKLEAMIQSMTLNERRGLCELIPTRRFRIAKGSGTKIDDVNKLIKQFKRAKDVIKDLSANKKLMKNMMGKMMGGALWR